MIINNNTIRLKFGERGGGEKGKNFEYDSKQKLEGARVLVCTCHFLGTKSKGWGEGVGLSFDRNTKMEGGNFRTIDV